MKDIKRELSFNIKLLKEKLLDHAIPLEMMEGTILYKALYFVFMSRYDVNIRNLINNYIINLLFEWNLKFNVEKPIYQVLSSGFSKDKSFVEECSLYDIVKNEALYQNLYLIKIAKKYKMPYPLIYDPLGLAC